MALRKYIKAKIHGVTVTKALLDYHGSVGVDRQLLQLAGIQPYESVLVVNLANGARWETYAIPAGPGEFNLNGGSARLGVVGDRCLLMTFAWEEEYTGANVVVVGPNNTVREVLRYEPEIPSS